MKPGTKLKDLLIGTGGLVLLTLIQILRDSIGSSHRGYRDGLELLLLWLIALIAWIIYLVNLIRKRRKDKEDEPWDRKEKDPW